MVRIQRFHRASLKSREVRMGILAEEWETYKNEIYKVLVAIKKPKDAAKKAAKLHARLLQITTNIRDKYF